MGLNESKQSIKYIGWWQSGSSKTYIQEVTEKKGSDFKGIIIKYGYLESYQSRDKKKGWFRVNNPRNLYPLSGVNWEEGQINLNIEREISEMKKLKESDLGGNESTDLYGMKQLLQRSKGIKKVILNGKKEMSVDQFYRIFHDAWDKYGYRHPVSYRFDETDLLVSLKESRKLKEAFFPDPFVKIKKEDKGFVVYLQLEDEPEKNITNIPWETKEQAEHACMMKGYVIKGDEYELPDVPEPVKPTKKEKTKDTENPKEMDLGKEKTTKLESKSKTTKEIKLEKFKSLLKNLIREELIKENLDVNKIKRDFLVNVFPKLDSSFSNEVKFIKSGQTYVLEIPIQKITQQELSLIDSFFKKYKLTRDGRPQEESSHVGNRTNYSIIDFSSSTNESLKKKNPLREAEITNSDLEVKAKRYAELANKMKVLEAELKGMEKEYEQLDQEFRPLLETVGKTKDTFIRAGNLLIKIEREGYEKSSKSYKTGFDYLYNKVNGTMKTLAEEALKMTESVSYVKSKISVVQSEGILREYSWFSKIKNFLSSKIKKLFGLNKSANDALTELERNIK